MWQEINKLPGSRACWKWEWLNGFSGSRNQIVEVRGRCHLKKTEGKSVGSETLPESNRYTNLSYNCKSDKEIPTPCLWPNKGWEGPEKINFSQTYQEISRNNRKRNLQNPNVRLKRSLPIENIKFFFYSLIYNLMPSQ